MCTCVHLRLGSIRACVQLIYNPQRKQNCKAHSQIFPTEGLVTGRHAVNFQEQAGLPAFSAPETSPGDLATCGSAPQRSRPAVASQWTAGSALGVVTDLGWGTCFCVSEMLVPEQPGPWGHPDIGCPSSTLWQVPPHSQPSYSGPHCSEVWDQDL